MIPKVLVSAGLATLLGLGFVPSPASAGAPTGKPIGGCSLLGAANATKILGGPAAAVHETNHRTSFGLVRGCTYSGAGIDVPYTVTTYPSAAIAKRILSTVSVKAREPLDGMLLMGFGHPKIKGYPSVVDYFQLVPGEGEAPPQFDFLSQVIVRKGATILVTEAAADADATPMLRKVASIVVPRM